VRAPITFKTAFVLGICT